MNHCSFYNTQDIGSLSVHRHNGCFKKKNHKGRLNTDIVGEKLVKQEKKSVYFKVEFDIFWANSHRNQ